MEQENGATVLCGEPVAGIVLCGGHSSRMGRSKAFLPIAGETMLGRVVRVVGLATSPVIVVAASGQEVPELPTGVLLARDQASAESPGYEGVRRGPLAGLESGLLALSEIGNEQSHIACRTAFVSSCDVPFLRPAWIRRLVELLGDYDICVPRFGGYHHPLSAVYRLSVLPLIQRLLQADRLRPVFLFEEANTRIVEPNELADVDPSMESLRNVNTPEEYASVLRELESV